MNSHSEKNIQKVVTYYEDTGLDYGKWSKEYNMHFGYWQKWMNPFRREPMLEEMNLQVFKHLQLKDEDKLIYDLGCGLAAPCRSFAMNFKDKKIKGITIVKWQIDKAIELNRAAGLDSSIELILGDYTKLPFESNSADAVYALESCCHAEGLDKAGFVKEMMRVLKPGKRFVIVDGFIKKEPESFNGFLKYCYNEIIKGWALPSFPLVSKFVETLKEHAGGGVEVKDFSFRVAPTAMQSPFTVISFLMKKMRHGEKLNAVRIGHLKSCLLGFVLGLHRHRFSYCMVTGYKKFNI